jgi:hypothetical protein
MFHSLPLTCRGSLTSGGNNLPPYQALAWSLLLRHIWQTSTLIDRGKYDGRPSDRVSASQANPAIPAAKISFHRKTVLFVTF